MIRGIESLDASREVSNLSKIDDVFEKRPHGAGSFKDIEDGKVYFVLWSFSDGVYSFRFITQDGEKVTSANSGALFGSVVSGLKEAPVSMVSPTKTIQAVLDENGRSVFVQGTFGTYLALIFPIDATHSDVRFFGTQYSISIRRGVNQLNDFTLAVAFGNAVYYSYEEIDGDLTSLFSGFLDVLSTLGFTNIAWIDHPVIKQIGKQRTITGLLSITNSTTAGLIIASHMSLCTLNTADCSTKTGWIVSDYSNIGGEPVRFSIRNDGVLYNNDAITINAGTTSYMCLNFDYSL